MYPQSIPQFINTYANPPSQPEFEVQHPITDLSFVYASANALDFGGGAQLAHPDQTPQLQERQNDWAQQQRSYGWDSRQWESSGAIYYESSPDAQGIGLGQSSYQQGIPSRIGPSQVQRSSVKKFLLL